MAYSRRRNNRRNDDDESQLGNHSVPFQDASPELGEIPLDDIDTFVVPARDEKGAYSTVHLNLPPYMFRQIQIVVKSGRFPYLDVSDFIRHAALRHLRFCVEIRESIPKHIYPSTEAMMEVCRDNELSMRVAAAFEEIDRQISGHLTRLEISDAIRLLTIAKNRTDGLPKNARTLALTNGILTRYGHILTHSGEVRPMTEVEKEEHGLLTDGQPVGESDETGISTGGLPGTGRSN